LSVLYCPSQYNTKGLLLEGLQKGDLILFADPSLFASRDIFSSAMHPGDEIVCTDYPSRSFYAIVQRTAEGWKVV